jgi:glutathione S-transferase
MGVITPTNKEVVDFKGLHLFHAGISNCSMRVRLTLEEKKLPWTSHHVDLFKKENLTAEYFGVNPKGLVPVLVDDGVVITESDDIIDHLDQKFPIPSLRPTTDSGLEEMYRWMKLAVNNHIGAVKTYIYFHQVQGKMSQSNEQKAAYRKLQTDTELLDFHSRSNSEQGFTQQDVDRAVGILNDCFSKAESILTNSDWLVDNKFSLADITWMPLHFTLVRADFAFDKYPAIEEWSARISERDSFKTGVLQWWPGFGG